MAGEYSSAARSLKDMIEEEGAISIEEVDTWIIDQGIERDKVHYVKMIGSRKDKQWWHQADGFLHAGSRDSSSNGAADSDVLDPHTLSDPKDQFISVAKQLSIPDKIAKAAAFYLDTNFNLMDPDSVADGLKQVTDISPAQKGRLLISWSSFSQGEAPASIQKRASELRTYSGKGDDDKASTNGHMSKRRYVALNGNVFPVDNDDNDGMTFYEAAQLGNLQHSNNGKSDGDSSFMAVVMQEQAETTRQVFKLLAEGNKSNGGDSGDKSMELVMKFIEMRMEGERERNEAQMALITQSHEHQMDKITDTIEQIAGHISTKKNIFSELDEQLPGFGTKMLERLINPPKPEASGLTLSLLGLGGDGEASADVSLDAYERIKKVEQKEEMLKIAKNLIPQIIRAGDDIRKSIDMANAANGIEVPSGSIQSEETECANPDCGQPIVFTKGIDAFQCPNCQLVQRPDGSLVDTNVAPGPQVEEVEPAEVVQEPAVNGHVSAEEGFGKTSTGLGVENAAMAGVPA